MIAFFSSLVMVPRVKKSPEFVNNDNKKRKKKLRLVKKNVVWGKGLNNKNTFLLKDHKPRNKMIQRLTKRERERQKEKNRKELRIDMETDMDIYLSF